jgi:hypothetical protein
MRAQQIEDERIKPMRTSNNSKQVSRLPDARAFKRALSKSNECHPFYATGIPFLQIILK